MIISWPALRESLSDAESTAKIGALFMQMAHDLSEGEYDETVTKFLEDAGPDDSVGCPGALPLLLRNIRAAELYTAGLKDLRAAILRRTVASPSVGES